jgi:hypothetical protein
MNEDDKNAPITEPPNSTVDDWHGQEVQRDIDAADRALADSGGDMAEAEQRFDEQRPEHPSDQFKVDPAEREGTLDTASSAEDHPTGAAAARHDAEVDPPA